MGRIKEFKTDEALDKATRLFWRQGYESTSLKELLSEMNILNGSFYYTFKDKKSLYLEALKYYNKKITSHRIEAFNRHPLFKDAIRAFFKEIFKSLRSNDNPAGCLMTNSLSDGLLKNPELKRYIASEMTSMEKFITARINQAIKNDEFQQTVSPDMVASLIITYLQGLFRISNLNQSTGKLQKQTEYLLTSLGV